MDDLFLMLRPTYSQMLLDRAVAALTWAHMTFKPGKSRSLVLAKRKLVSGSVFVIVSASGAAEFIPSIETKPIKFYGEHFHGNLGTVVPSRKVVLTLSTLAYLL